MNNSPRANFVLMDGGLRPDAIKQLYQRGEPLEVIPLYIGTRWQALQDSGPLLIALQGSSGLINDIRQSAFEQADASLLYSRASMHAIRSISGVLSLRRTYWEAMVCCGLPTRW